MIAAVIALLLAPSPARAWGFEAHRLIMDRAIALLPETLRPLFEAHRATLVERSIDPDTWRTAGFDQEAANHFLDIDWEGYGPFPFRGLPRDYTAAVEKFGLDRVRQNGTLPWRIEEFFGNLRRTFRDYGQRAGAFDQFNVLSHAAALAHYVSDAHVPFHAVINYDGQLTNQQGLHTRFETAVFERYRGRLTIAPAPAHPIADPREFAFEAIIEGSQLVPAILKADLDAIGSRDVYDDAYYASFFAANRAVLERRLNESITAVAGVITGAWEAAGKLAVPLEPTTAPQRRRKN